MAIAPGRVLGPQVLQFSGRVEGVGHDVPAPFG